MSNRSLQSAVQTHTHTHRSRAHLNTPTKTEGNSLLLRVPHYSLMFTIFIKFVG